MPDPTAVNPAVASRQRRALVTPGERLPDSAIQLARDQNARTRSVEAAVRECTERIELLEGAAHAWAHVDAAQALVRARALDRAPVQGLLHGVPIAVKDVIDTYDHPTQMGSPIYVGHQPVNDASCVARLRAAGALILGKTVTAEFAGSAPGPTVNPHDVLHTPGGSSSGSGAAVALGMTPVALGTQTGGSVLRPASFCGVVGYKPSFGRWNRTGVKPAADSLDTLGLLARSIEDMHLIDAVLSGRPWVALLPRKPMRIGLCRTHLWALASEDTQTAIEDAAGRLAVAGVELIDVDPLPGFDQITPQRAVLATCERAHAMADEWSRHREKLSTQLCQGITAGLAITPDRYFESVVFARAQRARIDQTFAQVDLLLTPCVPGEAPLGLTSTGDPRFQELWTFLHLPALSLPTHRGASGLPVGIQVVGRLGDDERVLAMVAWVLRTLGPWHDGLVV